MPVMPNFPGVQSDTHIEKSQRQENAPYEKEILHPQILHWD